MLGLVPPPDMSEARALLHVVEAWRPPPVPPLAWLLPLLLACLAVAVVLSAWPVAGFLTGSAATLAVHRVIVGRRGRGPSGTR